MFNHLYRHGKFLFLWGILFAGLALIASLLFPKYYRAQSDVLIVVRGAGSDSYTQAKSAQQIGDNLSQIVGTTDFYKKVMDNQSAQFDRSVWDNLSDRKQRKLWNKNVQVGMNYGSSLLHITVYAKTKDDAMAFSQAVVSTLVSNAWEYVGSDITIKTVNDPLVSFLFARPNLAVNALAGFVIGILLSGILIIKNK